MADKTITITPPFTTTFSRFSTPAKYLLRRVIKLDKQKEGEDGFTYSGSTPLPAEKQVENAANKFNAANEQRLNIAINDCANPDNNNMLLQMYKAYNMPELDNLNFVPVSEDTLTATYKKKPITIKCNNLEDGSKQRVIDFGDGSKVEYIIFSGNRQMNINGGDFTMPEGAICETKTVNGKVFSQLIQLESMKTKAVKMPEIVKNAEQILNPDDTSAIS